MGILNRQSDGLLSVFIAIRRTLIAYGPLSEDKLLALCAPPSVVDQTDMMARKTLLRWTQLGVLVSAGERVELAEGLKRIDADDLTQVRRELLRVVLSPANNPAFSRESATAFDDAKGASDFTRATAWLLSQDPYTFQTPWESVDDLQNRQEANPRIFTNSTRWDGLKEWGDFLGVAWPSPSGTGVIPNPAVAILGVLDEVMGGLAESPQDDFLARLADALPVLDGGTYRRMVEDALPRLPRPAGKDHVSASLSLALLQLEASNHVRLETRADAPYRLLIGRRGRELRRVSHVLRSAE